MSKQSVRGSDNYPTNTQRYFPDGMTNPQSSSNRDELVPDKSEVRSYPQWDYNRLKRMELQGIKDHREMLEAPAMTAERVVEFINQLSPWNLKTSGLGVLEAYVAQEVEKAGLK